MDVIFEATWGLVGFCSERDRERKSMEWIIEQLASEHLGFGTSIK